MPHASHAQSAYGPRPYVSHVVNAKQLFARCRQIWTDPTSPEKKSSWYNPQHANWPIHGSMPSFSPKSTSEVVGLSQASIVDKLLGLLDTYHQHAIGMFNTCSQGPTHRSLIDTGGGCSLEGADFSHTTPWPFQPTVSPFHLWVPPGFQFNQDPPTKPEFEFKGTYGRHVIFWQLGYLPWPTTAPSIGSSRIDWKVALMQLGHQFNSYNLMHI
jgi:hypothetical protein